PRPAAGTIPIWIGGHTDRALRRVATLGDGWHAAFPDPAGLAKGLERVRRECARVGRDPATVTVSARVGLPARRPADETVTELNRLRDLGVAHVIVEARMRDVADASAIYERFAAEVRPRL
ncbi:MAG TPA: LLM class flavin-dependent oxidoreductase, partial [Candidatus Tectomicrobia bacterium]|nr:LLM class flavin-dependent oxidoreductase [Candidatus Tectomicrobia bacterium]